MTAQLLPISARSEAALRDLAGAYRELLLAQPDRAADVCVTAAAGRDHHPYRLAAVGPDTAALAAALAGWLSGEAVPGVFTGRRPRTGISSILAVAPTGSWVKEVRRTLGAVVPMTDPPLEGEDTEQALRATIAAWRNLGLDGAAVVELAEVASPPGPGVFCTLAPGSETVPLPGAGAIELGCLDRDEVLLALARLYAAGVGVRWRRLWPPPLPQVELPRYPWQRRSYWFDGSPLAAG